MRQLILLISLFLMTACASYPDKVAVEEGTNLITFSQASEIEYNKVGELARWSGVIADIKNLPNATQLDVLYYPATHVGRPNTKNEPLGRFRVIVNDFLDPAIYKQGKAIVALGKLKQKESDKIGEYEYLYPTIGDANIHLWPNEKSVNHLQVHYGWYGPHPTYYWRGGVRYIYMADQKDQRQKSHVAPKNKHER